MAKRILLNVGGGASRKVHPDYADCEQVVLDIDPTVRPGIIWDARDMKRLPPNEYDVALCKHNLEHYYKHEVPVVLAGIYHVLKPGGTVDVRVPDILEAIRVAAENNLDIEDPLYRCTTGQGISTLDTIYGHAATVELTGQPYYAHKTGFTPMSLFRALQKAGFVKLEIWHKANLEIKGIGHKPQEDV